MKHGGRRHKNQRYSLFSFRCSHNVHPLICLKMRINKVFLTAVFCICIQTGVWCGNGTLIRSARTIPFDISSSFTWPQIFSNLWPRRQFREWRGNNIANLIRFIFSSNRITGLRHIKFGPEDGQRAARMYQQLFGYRGQWLIEQLGKGFSPDSLISSQPVPDLFLTPPLRSFKSGNVL